MLPRASCQARRLSLAGINRDPGTGTGTSLDVVLTLLELPLSRSPPVGHGGWTLAIALLYRSAGSSGLRLQALGWAGLGWFR